MKNVLLPLSAALLLTPLALAGGAGAPVVAPVVPAPVTVAQAAPASLPMSMPGSVARQQGFVPVNGARIHWVSQGQGPVVFLVHGYPLSGELFSRNRDALSRSGHRVVTIDLRGFGESTVSSSDAGSIQTYAADALAVMDALNIQKATIGGMSMGGPVVFEMYRRAPQRFSGLMLIDTIAAPASISEAALWRGMAAEAQAMGSGALVPELIKDMLSGQTRLNDPQQVGFLSNIVRQASVAGDVAGGMALANRPDSTSTLGTIKVPTLIIVGLQDTVYPIAIARKMQMGIAGSRMVIIPGAAHAATYEQANDVNRAMLNFLGTVR